MRIKGVNLNPGVELVIIPRGFIVENGKEVPQYVTFKCKAVNDFTDFEKYCPEPKPPQVIKKGGMRELDVKDNTYLENLKTYNAKRFHWIVIQSLKATDDIEWEKVNDLDSNTWSEYETEFRAAGFSEIEIGRIIKGVLAANCLDDDRINEARQHFLASQVAEPQG